MSKPKSRFWASSGVLVLVAFFIHAPVTLAAAAVGNGISVTPAQLSFSVDDTTSSQSFPITITNNYNAPVNIGAAFSGIDENANLLIPVDTLDPTFASALSISQTDVTIPAHSSQVLTVQVTDAGTLSAGGHYATLVLTQEDVQGQALSVKGAVSLTIFVVKNPGSYQSINLTSLSTNHWIFRLPTTASLGFVNNGNVLTVPRATVLVFDHSGQSALQKGIANAASFPLLPNKELLTTVKISSVAHTWVPQRVKLEIVYRADGASQLNTATTSFWYIPPIYLLLLVLPGWVLWREIDKRRPHRPVPTVPITHVPPLDAIRKPKKTVGVAPVTLKRGKWMISARSFLSGLKHLVSKLAVGKSRSHKTTPDNTLRKRQKR